MTKNFNILFKKGEYYNLNGRNPKKPLSHGYGRGLYNKQNKQKVSSEKGFFIRKVKDKYYNDNGKNPNKPLSKSYGKRLYSLQERFGNVLTIKDASGHGRLRKKIPYLKKISGKKAPDEVKDSIRYVNKTDYSEFLKDIASGKIRTTNLRTRFRAGFRVYHDDTPQYDSITRATAKDGVVPLERFLKDLPNDVFSGQSRGSFRYVIYDSVTKKVYHDMNYDVEINDE